MAELQHVQLIGMQEQAYSDLENGKRSYRQQQSFKSSDDDTSYSSNSSMTVRGRAPFLASLVALFGLLAACLFLGFGISGGIREQETKFELTAIELVTEFTFAWNEYESASRWLHQACQFHPVNRTDFRDIYEYLTTNLVVQAVEWIPKVMHEDREAIEEEARLFYNEVYPDIVYYGIKGFEPDPNSDSGYSVQNRTDQPFYYPVHFVEPVEPNSAAIELDLYSSAIRRETIEMALDTFSPAVSKPFQIVQESSPSPSENSILLFHPGIPLSSKPDREPRDLALLVIKVKELLQTATTVLTDSVAVYLFDSTDADAEPDFLIAAELYARHGENEETKIVFLNEIEKSNLEEVKEIQKLFYEAELQIASAQWTIVVVALDGVFEPALLTTIVAGVLIVVASLMVAFWIHSDMKRQRTLGVLKRQNDAEKAAMILQSAREAAKLEQELNDYIAHEVRNPLSAAMSACTFIKSACLEKTSVNVADVEGDVRIIDSSLRFINDLLRSMLDMHRAASKKINLTLLPLDMMHDLLHPVTLMLYTRDADVEIRTDCPPGLVINTDAMRLKQIILNLGRNSTKFVQKGYIKFSAAVVDGTVKVFVEDSGPGIPVEKRGHLFSKFQESLDELNQGTGMGLCLCKNVVELLGGEIYLDESFDSGVEGYPGTRFVVDTKTAPITAEDYNEFLQNKGDEIETSLRYMKEEGQAKAEDITAGKELPETLSLLFVDDDLVLRKLFTRSVRNIAKTWNVKDASSGEAALEMVGTEEFDVIFIDQYMASVEKQMLGTETTRALRARGVKSRICGLSANDVENTFFKAGADFFMFKPFPCQKDELRQELLRIIYADRNPFLEQVFEQVNEDEQDDGE